MRIFLITFLGCFVFVSLFAQDYKTKKTAHSKAVKSYTAGMQKANFEQFNEAITEFDKAIKKEPTFVDAIIMRADCYGALGKIDQAVSGFEHFLELAPEYKPKAWYSLAMLQYRHERYADSKKNMERFLQFEQRNPKLKAKAERYLAYSTFAANAVANPVPFEPKSLGPNVNTNRNEYLPALSADGSTMIYTVRIGRQEDFFYSQNIDGIWQKGVPIGKPINTSDNEGAHSVMPDGNTIYFTACNRRDGYGSCDIYVTTFDKRKGWTTPELIDAPVSSRAWESQPSLSPDGQAIYLTTNRPGGAGGKDIWVITKNKKGVWAKPTPLPDNVNTVYDEQGPFMHPDGKTLYFTSNGHPGMGGMDLYMTRKQDDGSWSDPINLGYPINTRNNEGSLFVARDGVTAFFDSDRDQKGNIDLYTFELHEAVRPQASTFVKATVIDAATKQPLQAKVNFVNLTREREHSSIVTNQDGEFFSMLPIGASYSLNVSQNGYLFYSDNFTLDSASTQDKPFELTIALTPLPVAVLNDPPKSTPSAPRPVKNTPIVLKNVFFETGSAALKSSSTTELNSLVNLLNEYPALKIRINGHTDNIGSDTDNLRLSQQRADAVKAYLTQEGIASSRLLTKGFGESKPVADNDTQGGRKTNRRTEFEVIQ